MTPEQRAELDRAHARLDELIARYGEDSLEVARVTALLDICLHRCN
jgi:hypothetical protein